MQPQSHWVHDLDPVLFQITDTLAIRYYGLAYVLGFFAALWLLARYHKRGLSPLNSELRSDLMVYLILGVMLGGRLGYFLLYHPGTLLGDPIEFFRFNRGGMSSHGGFAGVAIASWLYCRKHKFRLLKLADLIASIAPPGLLLGRIANFINGELWGRVSDVPWAVIFPNSAAPGTPLALIEPRHPSQLYQAFAEGLLLLLYTQWRLWKHPRVLTFPGKLCGEFLIGYAIARIACEAFRQGDEGVSLVLGLNRGAFYSFALVAAGLWLVLRAREDGKAP